MQSRNGRPSPPGDTAGGAAMHAQPSDRELTSENAPEPPGAATTRAAADESRLSSRRAPASFRRTGPGDPSRPARPRPYRTSCPGGALTPPGRRCRPGFPARRGSPRGPVRRVRPACRRRTSGPCRRSSSTRSGGRSGPTRRARPSHRRSPASRSPASPNPASRRPPPPSQRPAAEPSWAAVLATTVRLWLRRRLSWTRRSRPGRARWLVLIVAGLVAAVLLAVAATVVLSGPGSPSAGQPGAAGKAVAAAAAARQRAAAWVAGQDSPDAIVACDPAMCAALEARGVPAGRLLALTPARSDPLGSDLVVATAAVRGQFGARLVGVYAPVTLASFGSGTARIDVRVVAPDGAAAYWTALAADVRARASAGGPAPAQPQHPRLSRRAVSARRRRGRSPAAGRAGHAGPSAPAGHRRFQPSQPRRQRRRAAAFRRHRRGRAAGLAPPGVTAQPDGDPASPALALFALIARDSPDSRPAGLCSGSDTRSRARSGC